MRSSGIVPSFAGLTTMFTISVLFLTSIGCSFPVTWSAESRSPLWVATAKTRVYDGFGNNGVETTVEITKTDGSGSPERVLAFADSGPAIDLKMEWNGPFHLIVTYKAGPDLLYYQVAKTYGVTISVENVPPNPEQEYRPFAKP